MNMNSRGLQGLVLQMPPALQHRAASMANQECLSLNLFIAAAVAEKIHRLEQESSSRRSRSMPQSVGELVEATALFG